jgi:hypothetical protein
MKQAVGDRMGIRKSGVVMSESYLSPQLGFSFSEAIA